MAKANKFNEHDVEFVSPKGRLGFSAIQSPSTKFDPDGDFSADLLLKKNSAEFKEIMGVLKPLLATAKEMAGKKAKTENPLYIDVLDDNDDPTGEVKFKFKEKAKRVSKKTGKAFTNTIAVVDAKKNPITQNLNIGSGSTVRIKAVARPYAMPTGAYGVKLILKLVQILELVKYSGSSVSLDGLDEEDGFDIADEPVVEDIATDEEEDNEDTSDDDGDF